MLRRIGNTAIHTATTGIAVLGALELTTHLPSEGRSSKFYHSLADKVVTPLIRFLVSPEDAHNIAVEMTKRGFAPTFRRIHPFHQRWLNVSSRPFSRNKDLVFPNCIGLAAGFDKDGVAIEGLLDMGFGFVEVGSVTPLPQPGNPKPRMFRLTQDYGVINRFGFNSIGADGVLQNLKAFQKDQLDNSKDSWKKKKEIDWDKDEWKEIGINTVMNGFGLGIQHLVKNVRFALGLPEGSSSMSHGGRNDGLRGVVGINVGKNKESVDEVADYEIGIQKLAPFADYIVINISSPNTPNLRKLQNLDPLRRLLQSSIKMRNSLPENTNKMPLLVKITCDLTDKELADVAKVVMESRSENDGKLGVDGLIISNTTVSRPDTLLSSRNNINQRGGLSGAPLKQISTDCIRKMYKLTNGSIPIVGVGGVGNGHDAYEKIKAGASLVQLYSMMVYEGPGLVSRVRHELECIMCENGHGCMEDMVGLDHEEIYWKKREERMKRQWMDEKVIVKE
mmetsp:Transcript_25336/g.37313  ORF Transcript_25336/g.37313 Transcript_25336/m.37313 type:complete len:505 (+) Transcript_25336:136-1650(+)